MHSIMIWINWVLQKLSGHQPGSGNVRLSDSAVDETATVAAVGACCKKTKSKSVELVYDRQPK